MVFFKTVQWLAVQAEVYDTIGRCTLSENEKKRSFFHTIPAALPNLDRGQSLAKRSLIFWRPRSCVLLAHLSEELGALALLPTCCRREMDHGTEKKRNRKIREGTE